MVLDNTFQGVVCCCLDKESSVRESVLDSLKIRDAKVAHEDVDCYSLELSNKYYKATIHLFDLDDESLKEDAVKRENFLTSSHAIVIFGNGFNLTTEQLDAILSPLESVKGEPRILLCVNLDSECEPYKTLLDWSIKNGFDLIEFAKEDTRKSLIESLSAYKWPVRFNQARSDGQPELDQEVLKKLVDFDNLLGKLSAYRDQPGLRGNPDDKNIMEIAQILKGLLSEDTDNFLDDEDDDNDEEGGEADVNDKDAEEADSKPTSSGTQK